MGCLAGYGCCDDIFLNKIFQFLRLDQQVCACRTLSLRLRVMNRRVGLDVSDRPLLGMIALSDSLFVACGSSHSIYVFEPQKMMVELYTKEHGHSDWVTCLLSRLDSIYSAGMDGMVCKWSRIGTSYRYRVSKAVLFQGPISKLVQYQDTIWASSYDGSICSYDVDLSMKKKVEYKSPIIDFNFNSNHLYSADKKGQLYMHSLSNDCQDVIQAHHGPFSLYVRNHHIWTVGQDGFVRCFNFELPKEKGRRTGNIKLSPVYCSSAQNQVLLIAHLTGITVLNMDSKQKTSFPAEKGNVLSRTAYCCTIKDSNYYIGWGDGSLTVIDGVNHISTRIQTCLRNAIRCITITDIIMVAGDDGLVLSITIK
jgi:hypothetical protein